MPLYLRSNAIYEASGPQTQNDIELIGHESTKSGGRLRTVEGSGGDAQVVVYQRKTILTDEQIKALPTTYIEVVPEPGTGKSLVFHRALLHWKNITTDYIVNENGILTVAYGDWQRECGTIAELPNQGSNPNVATISPYLKPANQSDWVGYLMDVANNFSGMALKLIGSNSSDGDFTGGNAANTLEVTVFYSIVDL